MKIPHDKMTVGHKDTAQHDMGGSLYAKKTVNITLRTDFLWLFEVIHIHRGY